MRAKLLLVGAMIQVVAGAVSAATLLPRVRLVEVVAVFATALGAGATLVGAAVDYRRSYAMSEKNKAVLEQANAAVSKGDYEEFLSHCTEDVTWTFVGDRTLEGKSAVRRYMRETYLEPPRFVVTQLIADGDFVTALGHIDVRDATGTLRHSAYCDVWRIRDDKLAELTAFVIDAAPEAAHATVSQG